MKIACISDSHDNLDRVRKFVDLMRSMGIDRVIHCGDIVSPFVIPIFKEGKIKLYAVYGNNDGERKGLKAKFNELGGEIKPPPHIFTIFKRKILVSHSRLDDAGLPFDIDIYCFGHTHEPYVERREDLIILNPGELGGWLTGRSTYAILDLKSMNVEIRELQ